MENHFDQLDELMEKTREKNQRLAGLEHAAWQPRLATGANNVETNTKTCKGTKDAVADRVMNGDSSSASRVKTYGPTSSTSFGMKAEPPAPSMRGHALVDKGAAATKPCLSPVGMRTLTAAGGLFPVGTASIATRTIFHQPPLWFCPTKEKISRTTTSI